MAAQTTQYRLHQGEVVRMCTEPLGPMFGMGLGVLKPPRTCAHVAGTPYEPMRVNVRTTSQSQRPFHVAPPWPWMNRPDSGSGQV